MTAPEFRIVVAQSGAALLLAGFFFLYGKDALSALLGGGCAVLPTCYAAFASHRRLAPPVARNKQNIRRALWAIGLQKMVLTTALFIIVFVLFRPLDGIAFFTAFIAGQAVFALALLDGTRSNRQKELWQAKPSHQKATSSTTSPT